MPIEWAGTGPELLVPLDRDAAAPLRAQLEDGLRRAIRTGRLPAGERLPSSRELARQLGVSRGLVQDCYGQLHAEGYLTARVGSATRVAEVRSSAPAVGVPAPARPAAARLIADFASGDRIDLRGLGFTSFADIQAHMVQNGDVSAIDLGQGDFIVVHNVGVSAFGAGDFVF